MASATPDLAPPQPVTESRFSWRWVHVAVAALAMVATLPGRTHGLGLFTEPILRSLSLDRESYGFMSLWATLLGGLFCFPCGWLLDRLGTRAVLVGVIASLGLSVIAMTQVTPAGAITLTIANDFAPVILPGLFHGLLLTRGFGQSALSVGSLALIGRSAGRRPGLAMGLYAFLTSLGFMAAFGMLRFIIPMQPDWRITWGAIGVVVLAAAAPTAWLVRNNELDNTVSDEASGTTSRTLAQALASPTFWAFSLAVSFFGMVSAGTSLFNESILAERRFSREVFLNATYIGIPFGLAANLLCGWAATRVPLRFLLAPAMAVLAADLAWFPHIETEPGVYVYAAVMAAAGGAITVCFFAVWRRAFGVAHLGRIQGAAQFLTVVFSAAGPQLFGSVKTRLGEYAPMFPVLAAVAAALAVLALIAKLSADKEVP
jgi:MFS family permease